MTDDDYMVRTMPERATRFANLTPHLQAIARVYSHGLEIKEVADHFDRSRQTIHSQLQTIYMKLDFPEGGGRGRLLAYLVCYIDEHREAA